MRSGPSDTASHVLRRLKDDKSFVSGEDLSRELAVSRMAVSKAVGQLRNLGYRIDSVRGRGYRYISATDKPIVAEVGPQLQTEYVGHAFVYEDVLDSTNRRASELAAQGAPQGLVVVADTQKGGRGRRKREWFSPAGCNLYVSVVLRPPISPVRVPQLSLVTAVSLRRTLARRAPTLDLRTKWPNDIWSNGRKLAGILCEMNAELDVVRYVVLGMGINVNVSREDLPAPLRASATSLSLETGRSHSRPALLASLLNDLEHAVQEWLAADDLTPFLDDLTQHSVLQHRDIVIENMGTRVNGRVEGVEPDGRLRLRTTSGTLQRISSGDAHVRRPLDVSTEPTPRNGTG